MSASNYPVVRCGRIKYVPYYYWGKTIVTSNALLAVIRVEQVVFGEFKTNGLL